MAGSRSRKQSPKDNLPPKPPEFLAVGEDCSTCQASTVPGAKFCQNCGCELGRGWQPKRRSGLILIIIAAITLPMIVVVGGGMLLTDSTETATNLNQQSGSSGSNGPQPPDLSTMSPRQAADRLFNRVMAANERGNEQDALRFAPMALQAYGLVNNLDPDGIFHKGMIYLILEDLENAKKQSQLIKRIAPNHLLARSLEHTIARRNNDRPKIAEVEGAFLASYDKEMNSGRPEYAAHKNSLEELHSELRTFAVPKFGSDVTATANLGKANFLKNCSICHGRNATGTDKGPPLVNTIYRASHHSDDAFYRAVKKGVRAHHWKFGDMPPISTISDEIVGSIIGYVRELQTASGIE